MVFGFEHENGQIYDILHLQTRISGAFAENILNSGHNLIEINYING